MRSSAWCLFILTWSSFGLAQEPSHTRVSGVMFGDYFYNITRDANLSSLPNIATTGKTAEQALQFRRIYFTYDSDISGDFSARFRLEADQSALSSDGKISVFVKDAYLRWKSIFAGSDLYFGIQPTPAFEISEAVWGYRSLEKTILDFRGIVNSRDLGVSLRGKLVETGVVQYWLMIANGSGNRPENDKYKRYYVHLHFKPAPNVQLTFYTDYHARPTIVNVFTGGSRVNNDIITYAAFVGYGIPAAFNVGIESFLQSTTNGYNTGSFLTTRNAGGISVFGSVHILNPVELVTRFDYFDPNLENDVKGDSRNFVLAGLAWKVDKNVSLIPNILYESYEKLPNGTSYQSSLTGRLTLSVTF